MKYFCTILVIFFNIPLYQQLTLENTIAKQSGTTTEAPIKSRLLYDYQTHAVAYKDLIESKCILEILTGSESVISKWNSSGRKGSISHDILDNELLSKRQIWRLAGDRITEFCRGFPTYLVKNNGDGSQDILNDIPNYIEKSRAKRATSHYFQGRVRGQTQSQYLNFGNSDPSGKAEAESSFEGSKAVVSGNNGIGQAQSQSIPFDCGECFGKDQNQAIDISGYPVGHYPEPIIQRPSQSSEGFPGTNTGAWTGQTPTSGQISGPDQPRGSTQPEKWTRPGSDGEVNGHYGGPSQTISKPSLIGGPGSIEGIVSPTNGQDQGDNRVRPNQPGSSVGAIPDGGQSNNQNQIAGWPGQTGGQPRPTTGEGQNGRITQTGGWPGQTGGQPRPTTGEGQNGRITQTGGWPGQTGGQPRPTTGEGQNGRTTQTGGWPGQTGGAPLPTGGGQNGQPGGWTGQITGPINGQGGQSQQNQRGGWPEQIPGTQQLGGWPGQSQIPGQTGIQRPQGQIIDSGSMNQPGAWSNQPPSGNQPGGYNQQIGWPSQAGGSRQTGTQAYPERWTGQINGPSGQISSPESITQPGQIGDHTGTFSPNTGSFGGKLAGDYQNNKQYGRFSGQFSGEYESYGPRGPPIPGEQANKFSSLPGSPSQGGQVNGWPGNVGGMGQIGGPGQIGGWQGQVVEPSRGGNLAVGNGEARPGPVGGWPGQANRPGQVGSIQGGWPGQGQAGGWPVQGGGQQAGQLGGYPVQVGGIGQGTGQSGGTDQGGNWPGQVGGTGQGGGRNPVGGWSGGAGGPGQLGDTGQVQRWPGQIGGTNQVMGPNLSGSPGQGGTNQLGGWPGQVGGPGQAGGWPGSIGGIGQDTGPGQTGGTGQGGTWPGQMSGHGQPGFNQARGWPSQMGGREPGPLSVPGQGGSWTGQPGGYDQFGNGPAQRGGPGQTGGVNQVGGWPGQMGGPVQAGAGPSQFGPWTSQAGDSGQAARPGQMEGPGQIGGTGQIGRPGQVGGSGQMGGSGPMGGPEQIGGPGQIGGWPDQTSNFQKVPGLLGPSGQAIGGQISQGRYPQADLNDDSDSQVQTSVLQSDNGTTAQAQAQGTYSGGTAQSQVSGTYSGSGSFSASAGSDDGKRGAQTQIAGGNQGAQSSAQGRGGLGQSQSQVTFSRETGQTSSSAQSGGINHGTQSQVLASEKGGMADAQSNGPGSTSSQAQIGFIPSDEQETDNESEPFGGGGTAGARGGSYSGMSQSQVQGKLKFGVKYTGAAQAASGGTGFGKNFTKTGPFNPTEINFNLAKEKLQQKQTEQAITSKKQQNFTSVAPQEPQTTTIQPISTKTKQTNNKDSNEEYYDEDYEDETEKPKTRSIITQADRNQRQHIVLDPLEDLDLTVHQSKGVIPTADTIIEPGETIPGIPGYKIPKGFRGTVKSIANGPNTYAIGKHSQAQSATLSPGTGRIIYKKPFYAVTSNTHSTNGQYGYGSGYTYQPVYSPVSYQLKSGETLPNFYSSSKSETGSKNLYTGKKTPSVYYTQSSTCGFFTNQCIFNAGRKLCFPKAKTNPDGTIIGC